ncbi:hypothetical protein XL31_002428 [Salmonella enterica subsp. enterica]|nr:hypothetical protein [Salmonella enterica subsp. enterica serovar Abony]EBY3660982.1 hypothetical protein [Salmonella enterica subsp. enterica serovar Abony]ECE0421511.1 hypothetical protein [Salmonella enterica subsp. enterica serovar Abony]EDD8589152.1 hypothetical protein [Salmonella enterica subsp. enterica serovar Abony]EDV0147455.1 hypothetical protein [Salmonella enterica subsp. enterica serovar Abony]
MKMVKVCGAGVLLAGAVLLAGCSSAGYLSGDGAVLLPPEVNQGLLGDLNQYVGQLLGQRSSGNGEAEKVLVRLLDGKGLPEPIPVVDSKA